MWDKNIKHLTGITVVFLILTLFVISSCGSNSAPVTADQVNSIELNVCAGVGMTDALTEINDLYENKNPGVKIVANFAASGILQKQIEQGAPADVIFTPYGKQIKALQDGGLLLDDNCEDMLKNKVVLILPGDSTATVNGFNGLLSDEIKKIAIGDPSFVPAGAFALQTLEIFDIAGLLEPKLILCSDVRQVLNYVESGNVEAGIVFATDAAISNKVRVVADAPDEINDQVIFSFAIIKASNNMEAAKAYAAFLSGDEAKAVFEKYGFVVIEK